MCDTSKLIEQIKAGQLDSRLKDVYVDNLLLEYQRERYVRAIEKYEHIYIHDVKDRSENNREVHLFSAPGRTEIGGNHTDHQRGEVLAAAVNVDVLAVVSKNDKGIIQLVSDDYEMITLNTSKLEARDEEKGTPTAIVKGVLVGLKNKGYKIGGFRTYMTSDVLVGAGLSSSAAFENMIGTIQSYLYNEGQISPIELAKIGQFAEINYFGKPCGLMDQMASCVGNLVHIDFEDTENPRIEKVDCDFKKYGYSLCITDTKSSHADCTPEYAAVPREMKQVAGVFGKEVLREVSIKDILENATNIREVAGDRAFLRAIHFQMENQRVKKEVEGLKSDDFQVFLKNVKASGDSSYKYLQNVYMNKDVQHQNVSVALALSDVILDGNGVNKGVSRVHGGGFAGTIQAFVKNEYVDEYKELMNDVFGEGSCNVYMIRKYGGLEVI